ncbi:unnamed protein product, partial [Pylaiella littoralis]
EENPQQLPRHTCLCSTAMLSLRPVGTLTVEGHDYQPPLPLPHPTEASVVLVGGERATEHDSFNGSCSAKIVTPPLGNDVVGGGSTSAPSWGGAASAAAAATADGGRLRATMVVGEGGRALLAQFYQKHGCMAISDVTRQVGLHRGFIRLRIGQPRGSSNKNAGGGVHCMAGSQTFGSGLVFLGRVGVSALQAVRVDPWDGLGSLSHPLGDSGPVVALACHPSRPIVAACLSDHTIVLWDYQGVYGQDTTRFSAGSGGGGGEVAGGEGFMGGGGGGGGSGMGSPTFSPPRGGRGSSKAGRDEKIPLKPRLEGRLSRIATLSTEGMPWGSPLPEMLAEGFLSVAFHPARKWLCACTGRGLVGVWNLDGVVGGRSRRGGESEGSKTGHQVADGLVPPFAARVIAAADGDPPASGTTSSNSNNNSSKGGLPGAGNASPPAEGAATASASFGGKTTAAVTCVFLASEPVVMVALSSGLTASLPGLVLAGDTPARSRLVLLSLLDGALPVLYSVVAPHAIEHLCVEPRSGRIFAARSRPSAVAAAVAAAVGGGGGGGVGTASSAMGGGEAGVGGTAARPGAVGTETIGGAGSGGIDRVGGGAPASNGFTEGWTAASGGEAGEGAVSVLALASGSFLDRGPLRVLNTTMEVPPTVYLDGVDVLGSGGAFQSGGRAQQPLIPLPLQVYFLRSMSVLIQAGPGGGVDIPAVKAVLHAQGLERDKALKDRSKPRRLASLPGHTDDLLRHGARDESSGFPSGHLMPYRLVAGPLLRLSAAEGGGAAGSVSSREERRRFLVLYEIVASEGSDRPPPANRDAALRETSRTVCGLVTPAGYGEAHGRYENEAQLSHLFPATDGCFVSTSANAAEPSALLVEGGGYLAAVYSIPEMKLLGRRALSLPVTRVLATPDCLGSHRGKVLYVVRSPYPPSGFLETMVYSDRGGLQCPEPLLPVVLPGDGGGVAPGWAGGRPYANAHLVLEPNERVVDVKFQQLTTVAELATWGYRRSTQTSNTTTTTPSPAVPMVAVLTTRRVLIMSAARLMPVAEAWGHPPSSRSALGASGGLSVSAVSLAWAGCSVVCTLEDGRVVYLNPGDGMKTASRRGRDQEPDISGGGSSLAPSSPWRPLCSVDRRLCAGGVGIAACLPDRLCLVVRGGAGGGIAHLVTRPFFPLEPLVAGVLASAPAVSAAAPSSLPVLSSLLSLSLPLPSSDSQGDDGVERLLDDATLNVLRRIVARYAPPRSRLPRGTNPGDGPGLGAGATCAAFRLLSRYGLHVLAAEVAGVSSSSSSGGEGVVETRSSDVFMRRRPWIAPLERSRCAAALSLPFTAMMEGIGDDPALVDTLGDPDALTSALLPAAGSRLSRMALSLGERSALLGLHEDAARLMDLSGDDARLADYLTDYVRNGSSHGSKDSREGGSSKEVLIQTEPDDGDDDDQAVGRAAAAERLRALRSAREAGGGLGSGATPAAGERAAYAAELFRRSSLLAGVSRIPQSSSGGGLKGKALEAAGGGATWDAMMEEAKPSGGLSFGGRGGVGEGPPSSSLRPLALHCVEQWSGRARPECLEVTSGDGRGGLGIFASAPQAQPLFPPPSMTSATPKATASSGGAAAGLKRFATLGGPASLADGSAGPLTLPQPPPGWQQQQQQGGGSVSEVPSSALSSAPTAVAAAAAGPGGVGGTVSVNAKMKEALQQQQPWVSVGGSWRDEENVCGYWRFSEGAAIFGELEEGKQVKISDLSKYSSWAVVRGQGLTFEDTTSPVDPGDKGKVAEAVDVCFPEKDSPLPGTAGGAAAHGAGAGAGPGGDVTATGGYERGVFVRAARGSSIDVGLFHDDQRRSVATVEIWVNAGEQPTRADEDAKDAEAPTEEDGVGIRDESSSSPATATVRRRFRQEFHVLACRVSASGEHVWSLVVENNGQLAFIPGPRGRRDLGPGFCSGTEKVDGGSSSSSSAKIGALKEAVYTKAGAFSWDKWTHVAVTMDTSRDESSAEVRLFLDGLGVGSGTCRFNKVQQFSLSETWMVLGPDLVGWKLTEARVWAMLRDEEALQDWKDNSLSLAETKKARLIIRAAAKVKDAAPAARGSAGGVASGLLAPPPGRSAGNPARQSRLVGSLAPPPGGLRTDTGRRGTSAQPGFATKDPRKIRAGSGPGSVMPATMRSSLSTPAATLDPRKAALAAKRASSVATAGATPTGQRSFGGATGATLSAPSSPLNFAAFPSPPGGAPVALPATAGVAQQPGSKPQAGATAQLIATGTTSTKQHPSKAVALAAPSHPLNFATFPMAPGGGPDAPPVGGAQQTREEKDAAVPSAAVVEHETTAALGVPVEVALAAAKPSAAVVEGPAGGKPTTVSSAFESSPAVEAAAVVATPTTMPGADSGAIGMSSWANFGEMRQAAGGGGGGGGGGVGPDRRVSGRKISGAALATPTNSDVLSGKEPSASWSAFGEDVTAISVATMAEPGISPSKAEGGGKEAALVRRVEGLFEPTPGSEVPEVPSAETVNVQAETAGLEVNGASAIGQVPTDAGDADNEVAAHAAPSAGGADVGGPTLLHEAGGVPQAESKAAVPQVKPFQTEVSNEATSTPSEPAEEGNINTPSFSINPASRTGDPVSEAIPTIAVTTVDGDLPRRFASEKDATSVTDEKQTWLDGLQLQSTDPGQPGEHIKEPPPADGLSEPVPSTSVSSSPEERRMPGAPGCSGGSGGGSEDVTESARPSGWTGNYDDQTSTDDNTSGITPDAAKTTAVVKLKEKVTTGDAVAGGGVADDAVAVPPKPLSTAVNSADPSGVGGIETPSTPSTTPSENIQKCASPSSRPVSVERTTTERGWTPFYERVDNISAKPGQSGVAAAVPAAAAATDSDGGAVIHRLVARSIVLAGPACVFTVAEVAEAHARSPLLGSSGTVISMASSQAERATVAIVDLWNGGATTRYPIGCLSAILSPRLDEQVIALLSKRGMQVFSVTCRVRRRREVLEASDVRLWKWMAEDVIAIVTKTAVLSWDVRETFTPKVLFARHRPHVSSPSGGAMRVCDYHSTADGRWGLLSVADKEDLCAGCKDDPEGSGRCTCETSLMLDLHDFAGAGETRCFRALGAGLLDVPTPPAAAEVPVGTTSDARTPPQEPRRNEPLLAVVVPDGENRSNSLRILRLGDGKDGGEDCLCSTVLQEEYPQPAGNRKSLRESKLPAVPFRILTWRPSAEVDLLAVLTLAGAMTVFKVESQATVLRRVYHDGKAFSPGVVGVEEDCLHRDLVVLSAGVGEDLRWVVSRVSFPVG